ncbi:YqgE/AlgH family protein [Aeromicrobium sp. YIM 150415]|uniref:UPF0301 protein FNM00_15615 n=1 Tax=Aeromicrobium piscarium TaxID=2590901 RepID=A0A554RUS4_9ACTN|nr:MULTISPECIES: YqgE/AlgH family protein [Aeromicrobium]MBM9463135.1 YqgE/AlgH family protein [Aeromicrobium sp. YIM 150415]TSD57848.1 YqgE/AlgH family protein [Aeromicrobium piscarium]
MEPVSMRGSLLVATPAIDDGPFRRSVVFLLDHDEEGALGVIVNRPLDSGVEEVLPEWGGAVDAPGCLFDGGPVAMDSALAVGVVDGFDVPPQGWRHMSGHIGLVDLDGPVPAHGVLRGLRVFAGYAGWSAGQLEEEIDEGAWLVVEARDHDVVSPCPDLLWAQVLRRQRDELRLWATFPDDPTLN